MQKLKLGNSDLEITRIGFGAWAIGGGGWQFGWGDQDDNESIKAINKALEIGVNWIDTAAAYGTGHSEEIVGKVVKNFSGEKPYIFTKCGLVWDEKRNVHKVHDPESIRKECEDSLRRLQVDSIDLYQMHWPPENDDSKIDAAWEMMAKLKEEGKVKWIGVSNFSISQLKRAEAIAPITSLQPKYSLINRYIENDILPYCKSKNIGVIVYSPMASGLLTGKMTRERALNLSSDDWRSNEMDFKEPKLNKNLELVEKLKEIAGKYGRNPGEAAINWTLRNPAVTGAIVGARNARQVEEVYNASDFEMNENDINEIENFNLQ